MIRAASLQEIEEYLQSLGGGNHLDNMQRLRRFDCFSLASLTKKDFFELVFLQNPEVASIVPSGQNRTLAAVAQRAIDLQQPRLSKNWDLATNLSRMRAELASTTIALKPLLICEARDGEQQYGGWYLQDGSHRALAYASLMLLSEVHYEEQTAYCAMSKQKYQSLYS